ncbi:MAG: hypothetical protein ACJAZP_003582 [Psychromonas sp.]|jgi:hypothetical protein
MESKKPTEEELNAWVKRVHLGSCCSDPVESLEDDLPATDKETANK